MTASSGAVGQTPLIRIRSLSNETGCDILAKAEWMNPGGSVKDRAALAIIRNYEEKGLLKKVHFDRFQCHTYTFGC